MPWHQGAAAFQQWTWRHGQERARGRCPDIWRLAMRFKCYLSLNNDHSCGGSCKTIFSEKQPFEAWQPARSISTLVYLVTGVLDDAVELRQRENRLRVRSARQEPPHEVLDAHNPDLPLHLQAVHRLLVVFPCHPTIIVRKNRACSEPAVSERRNSLCTGHGTTSLRHSRSPNQPR